MLMLFEFKLGDGTDIEAFYKMMREKYPHIIGRKRFCVKLEEITDTLREDCKKHDVVLVEI